MEQLKEYDELKFKQQCIDAPQLVIPEVYAIGMKACDDKDEYKARKVIKTLIGALNLEYEETALGLYRLYSYCLSLLNDGKFTETREILSELNLCWNKALDMNYETEVKPEEANDPGSTISDLYRLGIKSCEEKEGTKVVQILRVLMNGLDFQYEEVASGFYRLYDYALRLVNECKFDEAKEILIELDQSWNKAVVACLDEVAA